MLSNGSDIRDRLTVLNGSKVMQLSLRKEKRAFYFRNKKKNSCSTTTPHSSWFWQSESDLHLSGPTETKTLWSLNTKGKTGLGWQEPVIRLEKWILSSQCRCYYVSINPSQVKAIAIWHWALALTITISSSGAAWVRDWPFFLMCRTWERKQRTRKEEVCNQVCSWLTVKVDSLHSLCPLLPPLIAISFDRLLFCLGTRLIN